jgi:Zn-dependent proteases
MKKREELLIKVSKLSVPYIGLLIIIGFKGKIIIAFMLVVMHECVHFIVAKKLGFKGFDIEILPIGAVLRLQDLDDADPKEDLIISMSGPLFNLIFALIAFLLNLKFNNYYLYLLYMSNLSLGIFNLVPAFPLDGGRIVRDILALKTFYKRANRITVGISYVIGSLMLIYSLVSVFQNKKSISFIIIGVFILIASSKEKDKDSIFNYREIL